MYAGDSRLMSSVSWPQSRTSSVKASKFGGTYDGAPGSYECTGIVACTVTVNKDNEVTGSQEEHGYSRPTLVPR